MSERREWLRLLLAGCLVAAAILADLLLPLSTWMLALMLLAVGLAVIPLTRRRSGTHPSAAPAVVPVVAPLLAQGGWSYLPGAAGLLALGMGAAPVTALVAWSLLAVVALPGLPEGGRQWGLVGVSLGLLGVAGVRWGNEARLVRAHARLVSSEERRQRRVLGDAADEGARGLDPSRVRARSIERERSLVARLQEVVSTVRRALSAHAAILYLRDDQDRLALSVFDSIDRELELHPLLEPGEGLIGWTFKQAEPFLAMEYAKPVSGLVHYLEGKDVRSFLAVPVHDHTCVGVLAVDSLEIQAFAEEEHRQILEIMGAQVAHWLQYADDKAQTQEELEHWRAFFEVAHRLQGIQDLQRATEYFLDLVDVVTRADLAVIVERSAGRGDYGIVAARAEEGSPAVEAGSRFSEDESWAGWALLQNGVRGVADLSRRQTDLPLLFAADGIPRAGAALSIPFRGGEGGGLLLWSHRPRQFDSSEADTLQRLIAPFQLAYARAIAHEALERLATTDGLTGLANRRVAMERLRDELARGQRHNHATSIVLLDVDHFKSVNDTHGHHAGDAVLRRVSSVLREAGREIDLPARHGGEEFLLILPETPLDGAVRVAERLRSRLAKARTELEDGEVLRVTASFGVAAAAGLREEGVDELLQRADEALYAAKESGRNRVCISKVTS